MIVYKFNRRLVALRTSNEMLVKYYESENQLTASKAVKVSKYVIYFEDLIARNQWDIIF